MTTEWFYELVRLWKYETKLSRFESIFAFETRDDAERFITDSSAEMPDNHNPVICQVEGNSTHVADMNGLAGAIPTFVAGIESARRYWEGEQIAEEPLWEVLLEPGATVLECEEYPV